jgi:transcriptional regulator with XRE-family HTH domain
MNLQENIKSLREAKHLSQDELASKIKVTKQVVNEWENGVTMPSKEELTMLSNLFQVTLTQLKGEKIHIRSYKRLTMRICSFLSFVGSSVFGFLFMTEPKAAYHEKDIQIDINLALCILCLMFFVVFMLFSFKRRKR